MVGGVCRANPEGVRFSSEADQPVRHLPIVLSVLIVASGAFIANPEGVRLSSEADYRPEFKLWLPQLRVDDERWPLVGEKEGGPPTGHKTTMLGCDFSDYVGFGPPLACLAQPGKANSRPAPYFTPLLTLTGQCPNFAPLLPHAHWCLRSFSSYNGRTTISRCRKLP